MSKYYLFGNEQSEIDFKDLRCDINSKLKTRFSLTDTIKSLDLFSRFILKSNLSELSYLGEDSKILIKEISNFCKEESIKTKLVREVGSLDFQNIERVNSIEEIFEGYRPLGVLTHIIPNNSLGLSFLASIEGIITGNINLLKVSEDEYKVSKVFFDALASIEGGKKLLDLVCLLQIRSSQKEQIQQLLDCSEGVSVWGGDDAITSIRAMAKASCKIIPWGHKISFAYIDTGQVNEKWVIEGLAKDIIEVNQQACSSPQVIFIDTEDYTDLVEFGKNLNVELNKFSDSFDPRSLSLSEQAELTNTWMLIEQESPTKKGDFFIGKNFSHRILIEDVSSLEPSPLSRTIRIRPLKNNEIVNTLKPLRGYLQSCMVAVNKASQYKTVENLINSGITRIVSPGESLSNYLGEPHDGVYALPQYMRRVSVRLKDLPENISLLSELEDPELFEAPRTEIMTKEDFQNIKIDESKAGLYFKSGGSSGKAKTSPFSYDSYHRQMKAASKGLLAVGLMPKTDKCINLFYGGELYGGFISFFTILENLKAIQYPMMGILDYELVANTIIENKINVILGMPSYILRLFKENEKALRDFGGITKILYGGEHFSKKQLAWLESFDIKIIKSASYGSVDAGPLGHQCADCVGSEHHLHSELHNFEILKLDEDCPVRSGEIGRLIVTTNARDSIKIERYDIGDLVREVKTPCGCGRKTLKVELLGRTGDVFRVSGNFMNFNKISKEIESNFDYHGDIQVIITEINDHDELEINVSGLVENDVREVLLNAISELKVGVIEEGTISLRVKSINDKDFIRASSGKIPHIIDRREK